MLSTDLSTVWLVALAVPVLISLIFGVVALVWAKKAVEYSNDCVIWIQKENKSSQELRRLAELETGITELADSYHALLRSHKRLRSRIGMRELRERRQAEKLDESPQPALQLDDKAPPMGEAERAAYKADLRDKLRQKGQLK